MPTCEWHRILFNFNPLKHADDNNVICPFNQIFYKTYKFFKNVKFEKR